jgi:S-adenosylmethionine:tRNA ribosyltransferase-isomerase
MLAMMPALQYNGWRMKVSEFDYNLPPELIAQTPIEPRDASRLLVIERATGTIVHRHFRDLADYLRPGDVLVCNDSRVIPARLFGRKARTGGRVELLLLHRCGERRWQVLVGGKRVQVGTDIEIQGKQQEGAVPGVDLTARVIEVGEMGERLVEFNRPVEPLLPQVGITPLPPYIHVPLHDPERYQTVYARVAGSAAAPTAGMHFTRHLIDGLRSMGVIFTFVTLHISMDTFRPVQTEEVEAHRMHSEYGELPEETAAAVNRARAEGRRVIAVGTTAVRVLESVFQFQGSDVGARHASPVPDSKRPEAGNLKPYRGWTDLFIYPGFEFGVVDALITNFHLPRSTLLMLVSAFAGQQLIMRAYEEAIRERYRFYSFGDCMLLL